jgi:uncharacterized membrane protein (UPF0182 family)
MEDDPLSSDRVIDIGPRKRRTWLFVTIAILAAIFLFGSQLLGIYIDALWFSSVGYSDVYWYKFRLGGLLFIIFLLLTFLILRLPFIWLNRVLPELTERPRVRLATVEDLKEINILPFFYRPGVWLLSIGVAILSAIGMARAWPEFAVYLNGTTGSVTDPIFGRDIGFYLFRLPVLERISGWLMTLAVVLTLAFAGAALYTWYFERMRGTFTSDLRRRVITAISGACILLAAALAFATYLDRFEMLSNRHALFTGISYTDENVRLLAQNILVGLLAISAVALAVNAFYLRRSKMFFWLAGIVAAVWVLGLGIIPQSIQSFSVKPNELAKESPYIEHNIQMTRRAFGLDRFEERPFNPAPTVTADDIRANKDTMDNLRLWDRRALQATLAQIQEIRQYYEFNIPDVDRYVINGQLRQVMLSAREMNTDQLPSQSRTWINQHLVYTHGYGVTMSTVNEFTPEGLPHLLLRDMPVKSEVRELNITRPEIYFGEKTNSHVYVNTKAQGTTAPEFNYPAGENEDSYSAYEGGAGIPVGGFLRKLAYSIYLGDGSSLLLSDSITSESRVMMHRNVRERVQKIAPFILFEDDPYIVITAEGRLQWIIDGFTYSDLYPYSTTYQVGGRPINYIRNSVKAVVDAYEGSVIFYVFDDPEDPVIRTYQGIFPGMFRPRDEMPQDLLAHVRYPSTLVSAQARAYTLYHIENAQTFYNQEDLWAIATGEMPEQGAEPQTMAPYHVMMDLPGENNAALEFLNILPFTPAGQGRSNMIGWMAARNDGQNYGKTIVYSFPKNVTVTGPAQIRARVNQDSQLAQLMTLWSQRGSEVLRGSLLVIPIADSLLYVEAFFLQAQGTESKLPELRQVAVATQDRLATAETFEKTLSKLFPELTAAMQQTAEQQQTLRQQGGPQQVAQQRQQQQQAAAQAQQQPATPAAVPAEMTRLIQQAGQLMTEYERLSSQGRHREAGEKLDQLKQTLAELQRLRGGP